MTEQPHTPNTDDIGARARTAVGWRALSQFSSQGISIVTGIILARLLMPADFGIIGMAGIVTGLAGVFQDLGFGQALVQRAELRPEHSRSAFWMTLLMGGLLYAALCFGAPFAGEYFRDERMVPVLRLMALSFLLSPFGVVPRSLLQRELDFRRPFGADLAGTITSGAVGITLALLGHGYWSLVWALLASSVVGTIALCIVTRYTPPVIPTLRGARDLFAFGAGVTGVGIFNTLADKLDYLIIGRRLDATALGLYTRAFHIVDLPRTTLSSVVTPVLFPAFSALQTDHARARQAFGRVLRLMATVAFPVLALIGASAPESIPLVFGGQWRGAVVPTQLLLVAGVFRVMTNSGGALIKGLGHVQAEVVCQAIYAVTLGVTAWYGASWGVEGVAVGVVLSSVVFFLAIAHVVTRASSFSLLDYAREIAVPALLTISVAAAAFAARTLLTAHGSTASVVLAATLIAGVAAGALALMGPLRSLRPVLAEVLSVCGPLRGRVRAAG